jgi:hypothetical protein
VTNPLRKIIDWARSPVSDADRETLAKARSLRDDNETIRGSQGLTSAMSGSGQSYVTPTPDVLHPEQDR